MMTAAAAGNAGADILLPTSGQALLDFAFNTLDGDFDAASSVFTAVGSDAGSLVSSGHVRRIATPGGTADFDPGFASDPSDAAFNLTLDVFNIDGGARTADANGTFTITDADGDTITGSILGGWRQTGIGVFFNGRIVDATLNDNGVQDGEFNGTGGLFSMDFSNITPLNVFRGAIILLQLRTNDLFFNDDFADVATDVAGQLVPAPAALVFLSMGMASGFGARRRRR